MTEYTANCLMGSLPPRWAKMWLLAAALFFAGKAAVVRTTGHGLGWLRTVSFSLLWIGMDAAPFLSKYSPETMRRVPLPARIDEAGRPLSLVISTGRMLLGLFLLSFGVRSLDHPLAQGWCGMIGLVLLLHFGLFDLLAKFWNSLGFRVAPIMNRPAAATSLTEFWGCRWNRAFRDLAHRFIFHPVARRWGATAALWASFAVSGLAHELIISVPAGGGYGLPTAYFLLQAFGIMVERRVFKSLPVEQRVPRWLLTHAFTALPAFFLFHPPFVERVMTPFFHAIGALP